tara:strand:+ start:4073 stop:4228 length:156 start_codon:yes stop_codon:yes gene_type:complete
MKRIKIKSDSVRHCIPISEEVEVVEELKDVYKVEYDYGFRWVIKDDAELIR